MAWAEGFPINIRPEIMVVLNYDTFEGLYLWNRVIVAGQNSEDHIALNEYTSYNAQFFKPYLFFDKWERIFELIPQTAIITCSEMIPGTQYDRQISDYIRWTNNTDISCAHNDSIWFSPACRLNTTECVPFVVQYDYQRVLQLAFFLNMPIAMVRVGWGDSSYDAAYYGAIRRGRFLFGWFQPDNSLVDPDGRLPVMLNLPPTNAQEQNEGLYRTGIANVQPRSYAWPGLESTDRAAYYLASSLNLYPEDIDGLMIASANLSAAGINDITASRRLACDWVLAQEARWRDWLPVACPAGSYSKALTACAACPAGSSCAGGFDLPAACPIGTYCPPNASAPLPCPAGRSTAGEGAEAAAGCNVCGEGRLAAAGACVAAQLLILALLLPLLFVAIAAALVGYVCGSTVAMTLEEQAVHAKVLYLGDCRLLF